MKCKGVFHNSLLKGGGGGKCSTSLYEDNLPNRTGLFANCCTQLRRHSNGHLHATVLMPQAIYILHEITAIPPGIVNEN